MKKIIIISLISLLSISLNAQSKSEMGKVNHSDNTKHYFGLHAGSTTGYGFSYRYWPTKLGVQVTALPVFRKGGDYNVSTGLTLLYTLRDENVVDFYSYLGQHLISQKNSYGGYYDPSLGIFTQGKTNYNTIYNVGAGVGFKFDSKFVDLNIQVGYGAYDIINDINTNIAGEIGIYYHI